MMPELVDLDGGTEPASTPTTSGAYFAFESEDGVATGETPVESSQTQLTNPLCTGCGLVITERFLLRLESGLWHEGCLLCTVCRAPLASLTSCYLRDGKVYCRDDYQRMYSAKCARCGLVLAGQELVFRAAGGIYHAGCFSCVFCGLLLRPGDHFVCHEGHLVCRRDYHSYVKNEYGVELTPAPRSSGGSSGRKVPKRPRTILTSQQRRAFKESFEISAKPCRKVREALARDTGLSVRVVQVWFQNQRAKMKKVQRKANGGGGGSTEDEGGGGGGLTEPKSRSPVPTPLAGHDSDEESIDSCDTKVSSTSNLERLEDSSTPINCLYSMQNSYFTI